MIHELEYRGYNLEVVGEYEEGEAETWDYCGSPDIFRIEAVYDYNKNIDIDIQDKFDLPSLSREIITKYYE